MGSVGNTTPTLTSHDDLIRMVGGENSYFLSPKVQGLRIVINRRLQEREDISNRINQLNEELKGEKTVDPEDIKTLGRALADMFATYTDRGKEIQDELKDLRERSNELDRSIEDFRNQLKGITATEREKQLDTYLKRDLEVSDQVQPSYQGFKTAESTTPYIDEQLRNGRAVVMEMSPREYIEQAAYRIFKGSTVESTVAGRSCSNVNKYAQQMRQGVKFETPYLNYKDSQQEGIHRALAAMLLGYKRIPVIIVR